MFHWKHCLPVTKVGRLLDFRDMVSPLWAAALVWCATLHPSQSADFNAAKCEAMAGEARAAAEALSRAAAGDVGGAAAAALWWPGVSMGPGEVADDDSARDSPASRRASARVESTEQTSDPVVGSSAAGADSSATSSVSATASALDSAEPTATAPTPVVPLQPNASGAPSAPAPNASSKGAFDELGGRL